jgi:Family of unknown function (DUF6064)
MSEWWTYELSDFLLFSPRTYYRLFDLYNQAIWPLQIGALISAIAILVLWFRRPAGHGRAIAAILAAYWLWTGYGYFYARYDEINWAGRYFAAAFVLQTVLLIASGVVLNRLTFATARPLRSRLAIVTFLFAGLAYPLIPLLTGRRWMQAEVVGVTPDPTVVATLGILLATARTAWELVPIPLLWCAVSGATLWTVRSPEALLLPVIGLVALSVLVSRGKAERSVVAASH